MPLQDRNEYPNLILLCHEHHTVIDSEPAVWTAKLLHKTKDNHERWVEDHLENESVKADVAEAIKRIDRHFEGQKWLRTLLWADVGNARFLYALQKSEQAVWLKLNARKQFRDQYLDMIDGQYDQVKNPPFRFSWLDALVVFPKGHDGPEISSYNLPTSKLDCPLLLQDIHSIEESGRRLLKANQIIPVPFLPTESGYIWSRDNTTGLPNDVRKEPCEDMWGAYYWVRPYGVRAVILGIGVLDPLECASGTAIWYSPKDSRSFIGVQTAKPATPDLLEEIDSAVRSSYIELLNKYSQP
jgi:hypothetical protein